MADINKSFALDKEDSMGLYVEVKDIYGFTHRAIVNNTQYNIIHDVVTGASGNIEAMIYDNSGRMIEFKHY